MRTAAICPTCATYTNAVCVIYDGPYLSNLDINPLTSLDEIVQQINFIVGGLEKTVNKSTNIVADQASNTKYPSVKAVYTWGNATFQPVLGFTPENVANKSTNIVTDQASDVKYPSVKSVYTWGNSTFQPILGFTPENVANKSTNTSLGTSNTLYPTQNAVKTYVDAAVSAVPVPNLQQVTDVDNGTTNDILIKNGSNTSISLSDVSITPGIPNGTISLFTNINRLDVYTNYLKFSKGLDEVYLSAPPFYSGVITLALPNSDGTLAISVNGNASSVSGDISINLQSVLDEGVSLLNGRNFQGTNAGNGNSGSEVVALGTSAGFGNSGNDVFAVGLDAANGNSGDNVNAFGTGAAQGNQLNGMTVFSNLTLPTYADHAAALLAITVPLGATAGCTYLYHNQATNSIGAVRL